MDPDDAQPIRLPDDLPVFERSAVRVVVLDAAGTVLLFHTHDRDYPELGSWWELPGGGIEAGRLDYEREDYLGFRWWAQPEIRSSDERFYPGQLPVLLDKFLNGDEIDEPFELWS